MAHLRLRAAHECVPRQIREVLGAEGESLPGHLSRDLSPDDLRRVHKRR